MHQLKTAITANEGGPSKGQANEIGEILDFDFNKTPDG